MTEHFIDGIVSRLRETFDLPVYTERAAQDFQRPCFAVEPGPTGQAPMPNGQYCRETEFVVAYYPAGEAAEARRECLAVMESLFVALETVPVADGLKRGIGLRGEVVEGLLHFYVKFKVIVRRKEAKERMDEIQITVRGDKDE